MGPQQYRLVALAPAAVPVVLGLNTAATYLGVTAAGVLGAAGLHVLGGHQLAYCAVVLFVLAIVTSELAVGRQRRMSENAGNAAGESAAKALS